MTGTESLLPKSSTDVSASYASCIVSMRTRTSCHAA